MNLSDDVAGATLMAAGGSAPEFFASLFGTFQPSAVGFGTVVGSAVFNVLFVIAMCVFATPQVLVLTWWPMARDMTYYSFALCALAVVFGVISKSEIHWWESILLLCLYGGYIVLMYFNEPLQEWVMLKLITAGEWERR